MRGRLAAVLLAVSFMILAACGTEEVGEATAEVSPDISAGAEGGSTTESTATEGEDPDATDTTISDPESTTAGEQQGEVEIPGDPFDIGPGEGDRLAVIGVAHDDVLNVRRLPDAASPIVDTVAPQAASPRILSTGEGRLLDRSAWWHVRVDGEDGWANFSFLGMLGRSDNVFDELSDQLGELEHDSLDDLVAGVAAVRGSDGPEPLVTYVSDPDVGVGQQQVVVDIVGYGDDALKGERITLTITDDTISPTAAVRLVAAEATLICARGVSGGACV